jgi:3-hydroxybutyryl-CoA dehydrogenase
MPETSEIVAVIGLGTMGHGIAQTFALAGYTVHCFDMVVEASAQLHARVRQNLEAWVAAGVLTGDQLETALGRLLRFDDLSTAVRDAAFVTEAIKEDLPTKQRLFAELDRCTAPTTILASNSSAFPISQSAVDLRHPERSLVTHWFNPPHLVPLVEIVPGPGTSTETVEKTVNLIRGIGKLPLRLRKEIPGFLVNRVQVAIQREVWNLLEQGVASAEEIDAALSASVGLRMAIQGPLEVHDFGGLDIQAATFGNLIPEISSDLLLPAVVRRLIEQADYGVKTGQGFHDYSAGRAAARQQRRDRLLLAIQQLLNSDARIEHVSSDRSSPGEQGVS